MELERYQEAIRKKVCAHCVDLGEDGKCTLTRDQKCGVELYLDQIVPVVQSVRSDKLEDYVTVLRERVCSQCKNQNKDGKCQLRSNADCGLDRFFELIVEAIEEVDAKN
jgi:hypothetical protein